MDLTKDYTRQAARWLRVLGVINLLGLNFGGLIWIWLADGIDAREKRKYLGTLALLTFHLLIGAGAGIWVSMRGTQGTAMNTPLGRFADPPAAWAMVLFIAMLVAHTPPLVMLLTFGSRLAISRPNSPNPTGLCASCGYDMRGSHAAGRHTCPECGAVTDAVS